ncbi:MAG TPA: universal stress protein [Pseudonocardia sp.]|nr:universal stress protein [Pseudonocardia sp.]
MDVQKAHRPIVVGVDGSKAAERAVRWAAHEAQRRHVPVRVVQAVGWAPPLHQYTDRSFGPDPRVALVGAARDELAAAAKVATAAAPDVVVEQQVLDGFPVPRLIDEAATAQLVVVGDRGRGGVVGLLLGSVAATLAARGACPVVVVRGIEPPEGPVVVGIDGSPLSEPALAAAFEAASARAVPLVAVYAWRDLLLDPTLALREWAVVEQQGRAELAERLAGWSGKYPDVRVRRVVVRDPPARALVEQSVTAQLVVLGSHGRGGVGALLLGSVSHAVLHRSHCPVMIVRA